MPNSIKKICSFFKKKKRSARKIFTVFVTLSNLSKTANRAVTRGESRPERRSGKRIIAGTAFRLEFQVR